VNRGWLLAAGILLGAAAAADPDDLPLPIPPIPPDNPPLSQAAPVPDPDFLAPSAPSGPSRTTVGPDMFTPPTRYYGDAYAPGSTAQGENEKRVKPAPGFSLKMPLQ
jgi:hypothetical protein